MGRVPLHALLLGLTMVLASVGIVSGSGSSVPDTMAIEVPDTMAIEVSDTMVIEVPDPYFEPILPTVAAEPWSPLPGSTPHAPIRIDSDAELVSLATTESWPGTGTPGDPIVFADLEIDAGGNGPAVYLGNTSLHISIPAGMYGNASTVATPYHAGAGLQLYAAANVTVVNLTVQGNSWGMYVTGGADLRLTDLTALGNGAGLGLFDLVGAQVIRPIISGGIGGIYLDHVADTTIDSLVASGMSTYGIRLDFSLGNVILDPLIDGPYYGVHLRLLSDGNSLSGAIITNATRGIHLDTADWNTIIDSQVTGAQWGFLAAFSDNNSLFGSTFIGNQIAIQINWGNDNMIGRNYLQDNGWGIRLIELSDPNVVWNNRMVNVTNEVYDDDVNIWDAGYPIGGNCVMAYAGTDAYSGPNQDIPGPDGIGDTPHLIPGSGGMIDRYPVVDWQYCQLDNPGIRDLRALVGTISLTNLTPVQGTGNQVSVEVENRASNNISATVGLYRDVVAPANLATEVTVTLASESITTVTIPWTPAIVGTHDLVVHVSTADFLDNDPTSDATGTRTLITSGHPIHQVTLEAGWNLVSIPDWVSGMTLDTALAPLGDHDRVFAWRDGGWVSWVDARPDYLDTLSTVMAGEALWAYRAAADPLNLTLPSLGQALVIPLEEGWNLVGYPGLDQTLVSGGIAGTGIAMIQTNSGTGLVTLAGDDWLEPGRGYWVDTAAAEMWAP